MTEPVLSIANMEKHFAGPAGPVRAVDGVSLEVEPGEFVAVQGPSGCGKTTLLLVAGGLLKPDRGQVRVGGTDLYALSPNERARVRAGSIGFVFQSYHLIPYLTVLDNVRAAALAAPRQDAAARAQALLAQFGLAERAAHVPGALSAGERQRTSLARALLNSPRLVLADEVTGNLDPANAGTVLGHLREFVRGGGAVLMVTHNAAAAAAADRTIRLERGKLVA